MKKNKPCKQACFTLIFLLSLLKIENNNVFAQDQNALGSRFNPLKIAIVPASQATTALQNAQPITSCIEESSKISTTVQVPNSYIATVEALGSQKIDVVFGDIMTFLMAKKKYGAVPILQVTRYGSKTYQSAIFVKTNSSIAKVSDLDGKKFAYSDASSASSYIVPSIFMKQSNMKFSQEVPSGSMEAALIALMQGQVDVAATFYSPADSSGTLRDVRYKVLNVYPNIAKETRVLWTSKSIPNEPVFVRKGLDPELQKSLAQSIAACVKKFPNTVNGIEELTPVELRDSTYDTFIQEVESFHPF